MGCACIKSQGTEEPATTASSTTKKSGTGKNSKSKNSQKGIEFTEISITEPSDTSKKKNPKGPKKTASGKKKSEKFSPKKKATTAVIPTVESTPVTVPPPVAPQPAPLKSGGDSTLLEDPANRSNETNLSGMATSERPDNLTCPSDSSSRNVIYVESTIGGSAIVDDVVEAPGIVPIAATEKSGEAENFSARKLSKGHTSPSVGKTEKLPDIKPAEPKSTPNTETHVTKSQEDVIVATKQTESSAPAIPVPTPIPVPQPIQTIQQQSTSPPTEVRVIPEQPQSSPSDKPYSRANVSQHNTKSDAWLIIEGKVYNATSFLNVHPGGSGIILKNAGKDCTTDFKKYHSSHAWKRLQEFYVSDVQ